MGEDAERKVAVCRESCVANQNVISTHLEVAALLLAAIFGAWGSVPIQHVFNDLRGISHARHAQSDAEVSAEIS